MRARDLMREARLVASGRAPARTEHVKYLLAELAHARMTLRDVLAAPNAEVGALREACLRAGEIIRRAASCTDDVESMVTWEMAAEQLEKLGREQSDIAALLKKTPS